MRKVVYKHTSILFGLLLYIGMRNMKAIFGIQLNIRFIASDVFCLHDEWVGHVETEQKRFACTDQCG